MTRPVLLLAWAAAGCSDPPQKKDPAGDGCDVPGAICTWIGVPMVPHLGADPADAASAGLYLPQDVRVTADGGALVLDWNHHRIRRRDPDGVVRTVAGTGFPGDGPEGPATSCGLAFPAGVDPDPIDPARIAVAGWQNHRIGVLDLATEELTWIVGSGERGFNGSGDEGLVTSLDMPSSVAWDPAGGGWLYFTDQANQLIRALTPEGLVVDIAGRPRSPGYDGDGGPATSAFLHGASGQEADPSNRLVIRGRVLYFVDTQNSVVRTVDLDLETIDTFAGAAAAGYAGDGGDASRAQFNRPRDLAIGPGGEIYVADTDNSCVRRIGADGVASTFAGRCAADASTRGFAGDGGPATEALLDRPFGVEVDLEGRVYIADTFNHVIRRIIPTEAD